MKNQRIIKNNYEFQEIIFKKNTATNQSYVLCFTPNQQQNGFNYGISVGKKIGNAVVRNKCKRQIRIMIKELLTEIEHDNLKAIIIVRKSYLNNSFEKNKKLLVAALKDANKLVGKEGKRFV